MFDHLLSFPDEAAALAALPGYGTVDGWDESRAIPGVRVILSAAVWDTSDPENPVLESPEQLMPGFHILIALPQISAALRDLPDSACRLIASAGKAEQGQPFFEYVAADVETALLETARIEPIYAGRRYY